MNPYHDMVAGYSRLLTAARHHPLGGFPPAPRPPLAADAPKVLIFSPHPDDECIVGLLALRWLREARWNAINVAVTQGSHRARQAERLAELERACAYLGFGLTPTRPNGLEKVSVKTRQQEPAGWDAMVQTIADLLTRHQPRAILFPHDRDWNSTHVGTHWLVMDALRQLGPAFTCYLVETEFWGQMDTPNLMVEASPTDLGDMVAATSFHVGEVKRNPYHLLLPAWMLDNVRRGGELVGGQGGAAPDFLFATLYRLRAWRQGRAQALYEGGRMLPASADAATLLAPA